MDTVIYELMAVGLVFVIFGLSFGFFLQRETGVWMIGLSALVASLFAGAGAIGGYFFGGDLGAWLGLVAAILLTMPLVAFALKLATLLSGIPIDPGVGRFMRWQWLGLWALAMFGHWAGGWVGLLTLSLPAYILFWLGLLRTAPYLLPGRDNSQKKSTFRSLLTFTMGTNYPYYFLNSDGGLDKRVDGNPFLAFFGGPGVVYTDCDHAAYVSDSVYQNRVFDPGLGFTGTYDEPPRTVDLRPQFRQFTVSALTRDDIRLDADVFMQFKIDSNGQLPKLGESFPVNKQAVRAAVASDLIENGAGSLQQLKKHEWDGQLVNLITTPILQDIVSRYTADDLCGPKNPRDEIIKEMLQKVTKALQPAGLQVLDGGIGNLTPRDKIIIEKRLENWRTQWEGRILGKLDPKMHKYLLELEQAKTEAELIKVLAKVAQKNKDIKDPALLRLIAEWGEFTGPARRR